MKIKQDDYIKPVSRINQFNYLHDYLNDSHIQTALKKILNERSKS